MSLTIMTAQAVPEGDGVMVRRLMPVHGLRHFDPFVLWDHFDIEAGGFPPHPHRGFEAITYLFAGGMRHKDNLGNEGTIHAGGAQRMTAGAGIVHSEFPDGRAAGIQLWINLPRRLKGTAPGYQQIEAVPESREGEAAIRHIVGTGSPLRLQTEIEYLDISLPQGAQWRRSLPDNWRGIIYALEGGLEVNAHPLDAGHAALIEHEAAIHIRARTNARLLWCIGWPHREPIHQHGPFVD